VAAPTDPQPELRVSSRGHAGACTHHRLGGSPRPFALSARLRGEREGTRRVGDGEGEVGCAPAFPHLTPTLSAPKGGEGACQGRADPTCVHTLAWPRVRVRVGAGTGDEVNPTGCYPP
jgi:hypothetical protein